jgi:hypothetical protein
VLAVLASSPLLHARSQSLGWAAVGPLCGYDGACSSACTSLTYTATQRQLAVILSSVLQPDSHLPCAAVVGQDVRSSRLRHGGSDAVHVRTWTDGTDGTTQLDDAPGRCMQVKLNVSQHSGLNAQPGRESSGA